MRSYVANGKLLMIGTLVAAAMPLGAQQAQAAREHGHLRAGHGADHRSHGSTEARHIRHDRKHNGSHGHRVASRGISCVPFARNETGIEITGNAADWWHNAAGQYARGNRPEVGSVLNFRANSHMHLGHVAAVVQVVDARHLVIDHANWAGPGAARGRVSREIDVVDVSPNNDWTAVRVELGHSGMFGSIYPTFGFIYARPGKAERLTADLVPTGLRPSPIPVLNPAPRDLRPRVLQASARIGTERHARFDEVAEAPVHARRGLDLSMPFLSMDAPNRSLR